MQVKDMYENFCIKCPRCKMNEYREVHCSNLMPIIITLGYNPWLPKDKQKVYWWDKFERPDDCNFNLEATVFDGN